MEPERRNSYIDEQLGHAVNYLATARGRIKERLEEIADTRIGGLAAEGEEIFPVPLRGLAADIFARLDTTEPTGNEGSYAASIRAMSEDEASQLASDIWDLKYQHERYWREREGA
jgi:hypothetical protein